MGDVEIEYLGKLSVREGDVPVLTAALRGLS